MSLAPQFSFDENRLHWFFTVTLFSFFFRKKKKIWKEKPKNKREKIPTFTDISLSNKPPEQIRTVMTISWLMKRLLPKRMSTIRHFVFCDGSTILPVVETHATRIKCGRLDTASSSIFPLFLFTFNPSLR